MKPKFHRMDEAINSTPDDGPEAPAPLEGPRGERQTLHRSATKRVFGGVCGGLGERFDVDANIVRVVFVVLSVVYGLGVVVYLAMWALIPRSTSADDIDVPDELPIQKSRWLRIVTPLGVLVLLVLLIVGVGLGRRGGVSLVGLRFDKGLIVLWLIFLLFLAVLSLRSPQRAFSFRRFFAWLVLGVTSFLILLIGAFLVMVQVIGVPLEGGSGVKEWTPTTVAQLQRSYHGAFGESTLNLTQVPFTAGTWSITVTQGVGTLIVDVPADVVLGLRSHVGIGHVESRYAFAPARTTGVTRKGVTHVNLNLQVGVGQIELRRDVR
jgi:phage shock protein PspC (stress-responsive transcriptional regulator)